MAALEYEVRDEYKDYSLEQLLDSPVTCFQGVGEIQSEILERYFNVHTVKDLAHLSPFLEALSVQEVVLEGGDTLKKPVSEITTQRELGFHIRPTDQAKQVSDLPDAPVHVLEGVTPGQDLALYDAFRITNVAHLAQNRIMLEARVIDYLAGQGSKRGEGGDEAVASILGARAASAAAGQARARSGEYESGSRIREMASEVSEHVRDRVAAMRDRAHDRAGEGGSGRMAGIGSGSAMNRLSAIRESREHGAAARGGEESRPRSGAGMSRTEQIMASRAGGGTAESRVAARSVMDRRSDLGPSRPSAGASRADSVLAARQGAGGRSGGTHQAASGGATVRSRTPRTEGGAAGAAGAAAAGGTTATAYATRPTPKSGAAGAQGEELRTEQEVTGAGATQPPAARRRRRTEPNPGPIIAAAVIVLLLLGGLIWFLMSRGGDDTPTTAGTGPATGEQSGMAGSGAPGSDGAAGAAGSDATGAGGQGMAGAGTQGAAGTGTQGAAGTGTGTQGAMGPGASGQAGIKGTHVVRRGDTLWFISDKEYADPLNWPSIFMENKDRIDNPDLIYPDQDLRIPAKPQYRFPDYPKGYQPSR